ncbi:hypothetical protein FACS189425_02960 [Clostridia bacterium]|nr:hypothetical protein FACS189425_02960 [Clostridia bacterium]
MEIAVSREQIARAKEVPTFNIGGTNYTVSGIVAPEGGSQLVWVKWHTPSTPQNMTITANVSGVGTYTLSVRIVNPDERIPPNPRADDTSPGFRAVTAPSPPVNTSASWLVWSAYWNPQVEWIINWTWISDWHWVINTVTIDGRTVETGYWADYGYWRNDSYWRGDWEYYSTTYSASVSASVRVSPDPLCPTAVGSTMGSGYGFEITASSSITGAASATAAGQLFTVYFPEFKYDTYWRVLRKNGDNYVFANNPWSHYDSRVHFTPVWYPDGQYRVFVRVRDAWTPTGELTLNLYDNLTIRGSVFDDWHIAPLTP